MPSTDLKTEAAAKESILSELIYEDHDGLCSCCAAAKSLLGFFASVDFLLSGNACAEIWLASPSHLSAGRHNSPLSRHFPGDNFSSSSCCRRSPLAVSQSVFVCCFWQISVQCNHLSPTSLGLPLSSSSSLALSCRSLPKPPSEEAFFFLPPPFKILETL